MPPPGPRVHQAEPELLSAEAPSVLWKVPRPPVNHRAEVLGKPEGDAACRSWLSPRLAPGCTWPPSPCLLLASQRVPCRGQEHPIPQAQHLSSPQKRPFHCRACAPPTGLREGRLSRRPKAQARKEAWIRGCVSLLEQRHFRCRCFSSQVRAGILQNAVEWVYAGLGGQRTPETLLLFLPCMS